MNVDFMNYECKKRLKDVRGMSENALTKLSRHQHQNKAIKVIQILIPG
jgi:hypothetical protein